MAGHVPFSCGHVFELIRFGMKNIISKKLIIKYL